jgi:hypothetical protein
MQREHILLREHITQVPSLVTQKYSPPMQREHILLREHITQVLSLVTQKYSLQWLHKDFVIGYDS